MYPGDPLNEAFKKAFKDGDRTGCDFYKEPFSKANWGDTQELAMIHMQVFIDANRTAVAKYLKMKAQEELNKAQTQFDFVKNL